MNDKIYRVEALRGFAALYVVLHHSFPYDFALGVVPVAYVFRFGQEAVMLFFLLSGFIINYSYNKSDDKTFKTYFFKRFFRIYIPLLFVFLITYLLASYNLGALADPQWKTLIGNLAMLQDWGKVKPNVLVDMYMGNGPLWSLSYEWWFYMLFFPIVKYTNNNHRDVIVFSVCVLATLLYTYWPTFVPRLLMYFALWWSGVVLSDLYMKGQLKVLANHILYFGSLLTIQMILILNVAAAAKQGTAIKISFHPGLELRHFTSSILMIAFALLIHKYGRWRIVDSLTKPFLIFAPISYVIYIVHYPLMRESTFLDFMNSPFWEWIGYFVVLLLISYVIELRIYPPLKRRLVALIR